MDNILLDVRNLKTRFHKNGKIINAVNGISLELRAGEILGIVGESGCGKSASMLSLLDLLPDTSSEITADYIMFNGQDLNGLTESEMCNIRGKEVSIILQDPMTSLNPIMPIGKQLAEGMKLHQTIDKKQIQDRIIELLTTVGIDEPSRNARNYPHQISGGMRQRVMIAAALSCSPKLLIADEPTTSLDVTIQAQILKLVKALHAQLGMSVIWITHDIGVIANLVDRVLIMYAGYILEDALVEQILIKPLHPYTQGLLNSLPFYNIGKKQLESIPGQHPNMESLPTGCPFHSRCKFVIDKCKTNNPPLLETEPSHKVACWLYS